MSEGNDASQGNFLFLKDETQSDACFPLFFFDEDRERAKPLLDYLTEQGIPVYQRKVFEEDRLDEFWITRFRLISAPVVLLFFGKEESEKPNELFSILEDYQKKVICIYLDSLSSERKETYRDWIKDIPVIGTYSMEEGKTDCFDAIAQKISLVYPFFQKYGPFEKVLEAAEQGDPDAEYWIARRYLQDDPSKENQKESYTWMLKAYKDGKKEANLEIARYLIEGIGVKPDEDKALQIIHAEIRKDNSKAYLALGECFRKGVIFLKDPAKARDNYLEAMKRGCFEAQTFLARIYLDDGSYGDAIETLVNSLDNGVLNSFSLLLECFYKRDFFPYLKPEIQSFYGYLGAYCGNEDCQMWMADDRSTSMDTDREKERCLFWLEQAASKGNAKAFYSLGKAYEEGKVASRNLNRAFLCYQVSAKKNYPKGISALGICYRDGIGVGKDEKMALTLLTKAEEMHDFVGTYELARFYRFNRGTDEDLLKAIQWYIKASEFDSFDIEECYKTSELLPENCAEYLKLKHDVEVDHDESALVDLGDCYLYGKGTKEDDKEAVRYFKRAVIMGNLDGYLSLGDCYRNGYGVSKNIRKAISNFEKCMEMDTGEAELSLGEIYYYGEGGRKDVAKGFGYALSALKKGEKDAAIICADAYLTGQGTEKNPEAAFRLARRFADQDGKIEFYLGYCYEMGYGTEADLQEALYHYEKAEKCNQVQATYRLAEAYLFGQGVKQDISKGVSYLKESACFDYVPALYLCGKCREEGLGTEKNINLANYYYQEALDFYSNEIVLFPVSKEDIKAGLERTGGFNDYTHSMDIEDIKSLSWSIGKSKFLHDHVVLLSFLLEWLFPLTSALILIPSIPVWPVCLAVMIETVFFCIFTFRYRYDNIFNSLPKWYPIPCFLYPVFYLAVVICSDYAFPIIDEIARDTVHHPPAEMYLQEFRLVPSFAFLAFLPSVIIELINEHIDFEDENLNIPLLTIGSYFSVSIILFITDLTYGSIEYYQSYSHTEFYPGFIVKIIFIALMSMIIIYAFGKFGRLLSAVSFSAIIDKIKKRHPSK